MSGWLEEGRQPWRADDRRLPVPPGFVVTAAAYLEAVSESGARARLAQAAGRAQCRRSHLAYRDPVGRTRRNHGHAHLLKSQTL